MGFWLFHGMAQIWNEGAGIMRTSIPLTWDPKIASSYMKMQTQVVSQGMVRGRKLEVRELCFSRNS